MSSDDPDGQIITPQAALPPGGRWNPARGPELQNLLSRLKLDQDGKERIAGEAALILGKCIPPSGASDPTTGLVLGYVQSGKTLSFTAVAALARDNGYPMVIVITGIATNLFGQSRRRLEADLALDSNRKWRLFLNPKPDQRQTVADVLADWEGETPDHRRQTVLITVLKNGTHLRKLVSLLRELDLSHKPVLVIDDEADQAGLNTLAAKGRESTTYQRLVALRQCLPHHTYLQYTATPQAPLLISLIDTLSPRFAELLTPGDDYVGGQGFFVQNPNLVRIIPSAEVPTRANTLTEVPPSLLDALRIFFLGVAAGYVRGEDNGQNRSMLVHPSRETPGHGQFFHWIRQIRQQWLDLLGTGADEQERLEFVESFRLAYADLQATVADLADFDALTSELHFAIRKTEMLEVNAKGVNTPQPDWPITYPWILVGGQAMDRGFTVEGLTVTYMPRDMGIGNADTIQQRARFFGYKRPYLGYCRVFLELGVLQAFGYYVAHEHDIRERLQVHRDSGAPLHEWRRAFFLDSSLRPTRSQVLSLDYQQDDYSDRWFWPKVPHGAPELMEENRETVRRFASAVSWSDDDGDPRRTADQIHNTANLDLKNVFETLLTPLRLTDEEESQRFTGVLLQIAKYLENNADEQCSVYVMSKGHDRVRTLDDGKVPTLFQGANYADDAHKDQTYPGDADVRGPHRLTVQIHFLAIHQEIRDTNGNKQRGPLIAAQVPAIAVWVPATMSRAWLVQ